MVDLAVERDAAVGQALDDVQLPHRAMPIERRTVLGGDVAQQLADAARPRQHDAPDVMLEVELLVVDPAHGAHEVHRRRRPLAEQFVDVGGGLERLVELHPEVVAGVLRGHEQLQSPDVHGVLARLGQ